MSIFSAERQKHGTLPPPSSNMPVRQTVLEGKVSAAGPRRCRQTATKCTVAPTKTKLCHMACANGMTPSHLKNTTPTTYTAPPAANSCSPDTSFYTPSNSEALAADFNVIQRKPAAMAMKPECQTATGGRKCV